MKAERIIVDPKVMAKPIIQRIADGMAIDEILEEHPNLTKAGAAWVQ